jgi:hypothetical protein
MPNYNILTVFGYHKPESLVNRFLGRQAGHNQVHISLGYERKSVICDLMLFVTSLQGHGAVKVNTKQHS